MRSLSDLSLCVVVVGVVVVGVVVGAVVVGVGSGGAVDD
jgi:hypothetical protein